jgi:glycerol-3-phosphate dehydrogenase (NAD(P)+)
VSAYRHIAVLGAGAWGTALANSAARAGRQVTLWSRDPARAAMLGQCRENPRLPGIPLAASVLTTASPEAVAAADAVLVVVPAQAVRAVAEACARWVRDRTPVIACAKGIERGTGLFMTEVIGQCLPQAEAAILSGPSFAHDVGRGLPTAVTLAAEQATTSAALAAALGTPTLRLYHSTDRRGVEIGGAVKNVLAIAAGIVQGRRLGASAVAALTTRGFAELSRFGRSHGARPETLTGLSGLGDLILTCSGEASRNFSLGVRLGQGLTLAQACRPGELVEGQFTAAVITELALRRGVEMPISVAVAAVLDQRLSIEAAMESLLARPLRSEH